MKKVLKIFMMLLLVLTPMIAVDAKSKTTTKAKDPVNFYIFYGSKCGFCQALHEYTAELEKDKDFNYMFNIVDYEVWSNQDNVDLMVKVGQYFDFDVDGVPFYVIGEQYFTGFSSESSKELIESAIKEAYNNKDYKDIVAGVANGSIKVSDKDASEKDDKKKNDIVGYIILGITAVVVIAIIFGRSNTKYYDVEDEIEEEIVEEEKTKNENKASKTEPKKETKKATTSKKTATKSNTKSTTKKTTNKSTTTKKNTKK